MEIGDGDEFDGTGDADDLVNVCSVCVSQSRRTASSKKCCGVVVFDQVSLRQAGDRLDFDRVSLPD